MPDEYCHVLGSEISSLHFFTPKAREELGSSTNIEKKGEARRRMREWKNLVVDRMRPSDEKFTLEVFRTWNLDCHGFQNEKGWQVMADLASSPAGHLETAVVRDGDRTVALKIVVPRAGEFWPLFLSRLGHATLLRKMAWSFVQTVRETLSGHRPEQGLRDEPIDEEFARLTKQFYTTRQGVAYGLFTYVDPEYRSTPAAHLLYQQMFQQLLDKGFKRLESQIEFGNQNSVLWHGALGFDIRNAGSWFHAVKQLTHKDLAPSRRKIVDGLDT